VFTGIVEATGEVRTREPSADGLRLTLATPFENVESGASISVNGVCLTAEGVDDGGSIEVFLASETVARTYLGGLSTGDGVNLERPMPADGRFEGHFVQGHVDGTAEVAAVERVGDDWRYAFTLPADLAPYVVEKGSIAVDGISLTVAGLDNDAFAVSIVPETYDRTTLSAKAVGDPVHLEVDVIAKYVERRIQLSASVGSDS